MNFIGRIYKTIKIKKTKKGFELQLKIKSNFKGINSSKLLIEKNNNKININFNENILLTNETNSILNIDEYYLMKPDTYNISKYNISIENETQGINIPIILSDKKGKDIISILKLTPIIYKNKDFIQIKIIGEKPQFTFNTSQQEVYIGDY